MRDGGSTEGADGVRPRGGSTQARVREWHSEEGWGVLDSAATPGGCWAHFSDIAADGFRELTPGQRIELAWAAPGQDGFGYRAVRVTP